MNREQKRKIIKEIRKKGYSKTDAQKFVQTFDMDEDFVPYFDEGAKVKLNYDRIVSASDYESRLPNYKDFVETNKDKILTVLYDTLFDNNTTEKPLWIAFEEDTNPIKWLFCVHDLISVEVENE